MLRDTLQDEPPFWHRSNPVRSAHNALSSHEAQDCETHTTFNLLSSEICWSAPTERRTWTRSANEQGFAAGVGNCTSDSETTGDAQVKSRFTTRINAFPRVANMDNTDTRKLMANKQSTLVWTSCPSSWETPTSRTHCETKALNDLNRTSN